MWDMAMVPPSGQRREHLFIVRIWQEFSQSHPVQWRGSIEHIPSGQRRYFASLNDLNEFISLRLESGAAHEGSQ